jgi:hypothetical protein
MDDNAKELMKRGNKLFEAKAPFDSLCQEIAVNFYSARADFTTKIELGNEFASHQVDSYPELVRRDLANAFASMLRPSNQQWFQAHVDDDLEQDNSVRAYLEYMNKVTSRILYDPATNMRRTAAEADNDLAAFGNAVVSIVDNRQRDGIVMRAWHLRDCAWAEDEIGNVSALHRKQKITLGNLARQFGADKCPMKHRYKLDKDPMFEITIRHCAIAKDNYDPYGSKKSFGGLPFYSVWYTEEGELLAEVPEPSMPYIVPRWSKVSTSQYAFSPATIIALPNARLIQRMMLTLIEAAEKTVDPPLVATHEAIKSEVDLSAGGITWVDREYDERLGEAIRPLNLGRNVGLGVDLLERQRQMLAEAFYLSKINLPQSREKTAYETARLVEEYVRNALPLFEPLEDEYNATLLDAVMSRGLRLGAYGPPDMIPEALRGKDVRFRFVNPLREAMAKRKVMAFQESTQILAAAAQFKPEALAAIDVNAMMRDALHGAGAPAGWMKSEEMMAQEQAAAIQMQQMQQLAGMVGAGADVAKKVSQASIAAQLAEQGPSPQAAGMMGG